jgi:hypothetical protein
VTVGPVAAKGEEQLHFSCCFLSRKESVSAKVRRRSLAANPLWSKRRSKKTREQQKHRAAEACSYEQ